jgi:F0F1-type ATP synthase membrane subunit b/b'
VIKLPPDITFVIQLVGFVVFWQLMRVLLFTPMQQALKARASRTSGARERAEALIAEAAEIDATIQAELVTAKKEGAARADEIRRQAESTEHGIVARYRDEATALLERARTETRGQVEMARAPLASEATRLAESVVRRVLGRAA